MDDRQTSDFSNSRSSHKFSATILQLESRIDSLFPKKIKVSLFNL